MKKKAIVAVVALALVLCFAIGGTLAWLKTETTPVVNTFTYGDINIDLSESENLNLKMIPGNDITKDPKVTVKAGSEACWLFVKVEESDNFDNFMTYAIADGWKLYDTTTTGSDIQTDNTTDDTYVIYREVAATTADTDFAVLANDSVSVKDTVTKDMLKDGVFVAPTLSFTAYAVQRDTNITTAAQAWNIAMGK